MGNTRHTCEGNYKKCNQPQKEAFIQNEKGENQFQVIICQTCWGVVASNELETAAPVKKKRSLPAKNEAKTEAVPLPEITTKVEEEKVEVIPVSSNLQETTTEKTQESIDPKEALVTKLEAEGKTAVDIILALKANMGMTNAGAANFLSTRAALKPKPVVVEEPQEAVQEAPVTEAPVVVEPAFVATDEMPWDDTPEVVAETKEEAPIIPMPLTKEQSEQREASPIKPKEIRVIPKTQNKFPINFFELIPETKSYRFKLHTEEGVDFTFEITPNPLKYEAVSKNPTVFNDKKLILKYSKVDDAECPIEPTLLGAE